MYTIKSQTADGAYYYLCNHWNENNTFWMSRSDIRLDRLFKTPGLAKRSLKHLLKIMPDYWDDKFTVVKITEDRMIKETEKIIAVTITYDDKCSHNGYLEVADIGLLCKQIVSSQI